MIISQGAYDFIKEVYQRTERKEPLSGTIVRMYINGSTYDRLKIKGFLNELAEAGIIEYVSQFGTAPVANGFRFENSDQIRNYVHAA